MRKRIINQQQNEKIPANQVWLNIEKLAEVEITSEDAAHTIESALLTDHSSGWRASTSGKQTIRLLFDSPQQIQRIWLNFEETSVERTQEYVLCWSSDDGQTFQEIVRQQWNFSPEGTTTETEDHLVSLTAVNILELSITPDISKGNAIASLLQLRLA